MSNGKNPTSGNAIHKRLDQNLSTQKHIIKGAIDSIFAPSLFTGLNFFRGIVLEVIIDNRTLTWEDFLFTKETSTNTLPKYRIRVDDIHSHIPDPYLDEQGRRMEEPDKLLIGMHPIFVSFSELVQPASVGQLVWVTFGNNKTYEDPIYFSPIYNDSKKKSETNVAIRIKVIQDLLISGVPLKFLGTVLQDLSNNIKPQTIKELLEQISKGEGTTDEDAIKYGYKSESGYDVTLGYGAYDPSTFNSKETPLSSKTIREVLKIQQGILARHGFSSAVGKYQIVGKTLKALTKQLNIKDTEIFSPSIQDKLAEALLYQRGLKKYLEGKITAQGFQNSLAVEWASIAVYGTQSSYYVNQTAKTKSEDIHKIILGLTA